MTADAGLADFNKFFSNSSTVHILLGWTVGSNSVELVELSKDLGLFVYDSIWKIKQYFYSQKIPFPFEATNS